jgi:hypothetical protein
VFEAFAAAARRLDLYGCRLGEKLLDEARSLFKPLPYESDFIRADIQEVESGHAEAPSEERDTFISQLMERGVRYQEALEQYENEQYLSKKFNMDSFFTYARNMKINFGKVVRES